MDKWCQRLGSHITIARAYRQELPWSVEEKAKDTDWPCCAVGGLRGMHRIQWQHRLGLTLL